MSRDTVSDVENGVGVVASGSRSLASVGVFERWVAPTFAALCLFASAYGLALYPFARTELAAGLVVYTAAILWRPVLTLVLLPLLLTLLNLAPWSGSLLLEEYDLFVLANIGALLLRRHYSLSVDLGRDQRVLLVLLILSYAISLCRGLVQISQAELTTVFTYDNPANALRVAKGFFWALLFLPAISALWRRDPFQAAAYVAWGFALSGLAIGLVAVWERGVFAALSETRSPYAVLAAMLDFTTRYRITGMFSEMHVGGEFIDGFIAIVWPFGLILALHARRSLPRIAAVASVLAVAYAAVCTFSRVTYAAVGLGILVFLLLFLRGWLARTAANQRSSGLSTVLINVTALLAAIIVYPRGGVVGLYVALASWAVAVMIGHMIWHRSPIAKYSAVLLGVLAAAAMAYRMSTTRWAENPIEFSLFVAGALAAALVASGVGLGRQLGTVITRGRVLALIALVAGSLAIAAPAAFGYRMEVRFAASVVDLPFRVQHWRNVVSLTAQDVLTRLFGMGLGQFPYTYIGSRVAAKENFYDLRVDNGNRYLTLTEGGQLRFTQRISLSANSDQVLTLKLRSVSESYMFRLRLCRRHILPAREDDPDCLVYLMDLIDTGGQWQEMHWRFNTGSLGDSEVFGRHPLTLEISNLRNCDRRFMPTAIVDVDDIVVRDAAGRDAVRNGDFTAGLERWFPYSDWGHLRWHVKNTWVAIYFDQGLLGVIGFGGFVLALLAGTVRRVWRHDHWHESTLASAGQFSLISFLVLTLFASPFDAPRITLMTYFLFFAIAVDLGVGAGPDQPDAEVEDRRVGSL